ncbi:MFS transporter [Modestobacter sp. Leaf380]|uniref:MFS transporter n=1 Tax=Modestobacter sp. Leaf380 TaxID=1736356 RepID=UPI000A6EE01B|nr:MFS transporter [Modestobacter sp. Leaf380]
MDAVSADPAPRARRRWGRRGDAGSTAGAATSPLQVARVHTRPLPTAATTPPGDDSPTVVAPLGDTSPRVETWRPVPAAAREPAQPTTVLPPAAAPSGAPAEPVRGLGARPAKLTVTRVAAHRTRQLTGAAVRRVNAASRADGAGESGLAGLLWVNALHMAGDAMIAVSLAGTLFFAASTDAQRGNVALYLLVTMAPFAVVAPVIGPLLDRLQRGRRWALAGSLVGRAVLAVVMAAHYDDLALYPAALGVLVLSKALNVLRAAVVPRVLPAQMSLTSANARLSVFGLLTAGVLGGIGAGIARFAGFDWLLYATAAVFVLSGLLAVRLPGHVDAPLPGLPADVLTDGIDAQGRRSRRALGPHVVTALRATAALRGLAGFLTIFSAFLVQATVADAWDATLSLGVIAAAAGVGSVVGTGIGSRLHAVSPDRLVLAAAGSAAVITVAAAVFYSFAMAAVVAGVSAIANALGKVALDAIIQREVREELRASAFARSETLLQLTWVFGGALGIGLPTIGWLGFTVAASLLTLAVGLVLWGGRPNAPAPRVDRAPGGRGLLRRGRRGGRTDRTQQQEQGWA